MRTWNGIYRHIRSLQSLTQESVVSDLIHSRVARERLADRLAQAEQERLTEDARRRAHRTELDRVRASLLLVPRRNPETRREA